jgi:hypothetical protein
MHGMAAGGVLIIANMPDAGTHTNQITTPLMYGRLLDVQVRGHQGFASAADILFASCQRH